MYLVRMQAIDLLINAKWIAPVEPDNIASPHHSIAVNDGLIASIGPSAELAESCQATETIDLSDHVLIPGMVNAHTHAAMTLLRGYADDLPLMDWLQNHIWPAEAKWANDEFVRIGTDLAIAEMLRGGVTCFNDMYYFPDVTAQRAEVAGMRACVGLIVLESPTAWAANPDEYLEKGIQVHDDYRHSDLVFTAFAPHAPYTVSDDSLKRIQVLADELDIPVHMHVHETAHEVQEATARYGMRPLERLSQLELLNSRLLAVHMTQLLDEEIAALADHNVNVVHCPESNLKLASGACPVQSLLDAGVNVALGTDGAASNNDLDMIGEMRTSAMLAKSVSENPMALPAKEALRVATIGGAHALGRSDQIGSLVTGKAADIVAINLSDVRTQPVYDPIAQIVYSAGRDQVSHVWIAGKAVVRSGQLLTVNQESILNEAAQFASQIADSALEN